MTDYRPAKPPLSSEAKRYNRSWEELGPYSIGPEDWRDHLIVQHFVADRWVEAGKTDFLWLDKICRDAAKEAAGNQKFDLAWKYWHEAMSFVHKQNPHAHGIYHDELANILRKEGRHKQALGHIIYWVACGRDRPLKSHESKFRAYFNRLKFSYMTLSEAEAFVESLKGPPDLRAIFQAVESWN